MIAIETISKSTNYIVGLFKNRAKAEKVFEQIIDKNSHQIIEHSNIQFPFYCFEMHKKFKYFQTKEELIEELRKIKLVKIKDDYHDYGIVFNFTKEYISKNINADTMGKLQEHHLTNEDFKNNFKFIE